MDQQKLPMRTGVGIILLNNKNQVFVGKRKDNPGNKWQMPQGGVDKGEDFLEAMKRELYEETSVKNIEIIKEIEKEYEYELPQNLGRHDPDPLRQQLGGGAPISDQGRPDARRGLARARVLDQLPLLEAVRGGHGNEALRRLRRVIGRRRGRD